ncbi:MAG: flavodoxin family protein [Evtepia sp.]|uniref:flavodoxin family protein n=1 Tax=Evtepia sp. TaxID=2773933 RepID=UPI002A75B683|nr:flavodoxin family protein [Evtepia sp.]MDY3014181.1 flavodoxin family protein [Evtepia sp.]
MKIIGINGSPRANGNTKSALDAMGKIFAEESIDFEVLHIGHQLSPCSGCFRCAKTHTCTLPDDGLNRFYEQLIQADGLVFGSPVYFASITSGMRCFMDRIGCIDMNNGRQFRFKVGVPVVVARRAGAVNAMDELIHYLNYAQMLIPGSVYWPLAFGNRPGEVWQDEEGIQTLEVLARNMAYVMKVMDAGKAQHPVPELPRKYYTNFIR